MHLLRLLLITLIIIYVQKMFLLRHSFSVCGIEGYQINLDAWTRFVCCVYLLKHKTLYNSERMSSLFISLTNNPLDED